MFELNHGEYGKHLTSLIKSIIDSEEDIDNAEAELSFIKDERKELQQEYMIKNKTKARAKVKFKKEEQDPRNSKLLGQPIRAKIEEILADISIRCSDYYGRKMEGPGCQKLLTVHESFLRSL